MRYDFPSRRKGNRPTHIEIGTLNPDGSKGLAHVPVTEYPATAFLPNFGRANVFLGAPPHLETLSHVPVGYGSEGIDEFQKKYNWDGKVSLRWMPVEFGQMILKICYAHATAIFGYGSFRPICLDQILNKNKNISHLFGQNGINEYRKGVSKLIDVKPFYFIMRHRILIAFHFSFLPGAGTPIYEAVVGDVHTQDQFEFFRRKMADGSLDADPEGATADQRRPLEDP